MFIPSFLTCKSVMTPEPHVNPISTGTRAKREVGPEIENSIIRLMHETVRHLNKTDCWMCMHIPSSAEGPVVAAVPLSHLQFLTVNWRNLTSNNLNKACDDTKDAASLQKYYITAPDIVNKIENVAREHTPQGCNQTRIIGMAIISSIEGNFGSLLTVKSYHAQIDCEAGESGTHCNCPLVGAICNRSHNIPRIECSTVLTSSRLAPPTLRATRCAETRCELPHSTNPTLKEQKTSRHQFTKTKLFNVTNCINITQPNLNPKDVIHLENSNCIGQLHKLSLNESIQISPNSVDLPTGVFLACGRKMYSFVPNRMEGTCYLAYAVPMLRVVTQQEIQVLDGHHAKHKRDLQRFLGMIIPGYGVYLNQQETKALSTALEAHINSTDRVVTAMSTQLEEVTKVALQNRMALDLILASTGGVCKIIGSECCSYVHSANLSVVKFHRENSKAINDLAKITSWDIESVFGNWFSDWSTPFVRNTIMFFVALLIIVIILIITIACVKACVKQLTTAAVSQFIIVEPMQNKYPALTRVAGTYPASDWNSLSSEEEE